MNISHQTIEENVKLYEDFMALALNEAKNALQAEEIPVGCVIVKNHEVIGRGYNNTNITRNGTAHAEMIAISNMMRDRDILTLDDCDVFVTCEPCIMCSAALGRLRVRRVYFGCYNDRFGGNGSILNVHTETRLKDMQPYEVFPCIMKDQAIELFHTFYSTENRRAPLDKRKRKYPSITAADNSTA